MKEDIGLKEAVVALRKELLEAQKEAADQDLKFKIDEIELELELVTSKEGEGGGGVKFWVYNAEAQVSANEAKTHKLKLRLKPLNAADRSPFDVSDEDTLEG